MKIEEFNKFMLSKEQESSKKNMTNDNKNQVKFNYGEGPVVTTLEEIARHYDFDESTFLDYYYKYDGNVNLAALATQNDKRSYQQFEFLQQMLGIGYVMSQNPQELLAKYNIFLSQRESLIRQLEHFIVSSKGKGYTLRVNGDQLRLLMLKVNPQKAITSLRRNEENIPTYAENAKTIAMEILIKVADSDISALSTTDISILNNALSKDFVGDILKSLTPGLELTREMAIAVFNLFALNFITTSKNIEVFEELCEGFELNKPELSNTEDEGPKLSFKRNSSTPKL